MGCQLGVSRLKASAIVLPWGRLQTNAVHRGMFRSLRLEPRLSSVLTKQNAKHGALRGWKMNLSSYKYTCSKVLLFIYLFIYLFKVVQIQPKQSSN